MANTNFPKRTSGSDVSRSGDSDAALDLLLPGVLIDGAYKLTERIPRWVALRRFLATTLESGDPVCFLFFQTDQITREYWRDAAPQLQRMRDPALFPVEHLGTFQKLTYVISPIGGGIPAEIILENEGPFPPGEVRRILGFLHPALRRLEEAGIPFPKVNPGTILLPGESIDKPPLLFPLRLEATDASQPTRSLLLLRNLAFELATGLPVPREFTPERCNVLPQALQERWSELFTENPTIPNFEEFLRQPLPGLFETKPSRNLPPPRDPVPPKRSSAQRETQGEQTGFFAEDQRPVIRDSDFRRDSKPIHSGFWADMVGAVAVLAVAGLIGWLAWSLIWQLTPEGTRAEFRALQASNSTRSTIDPDAPRMGAAEVSPTRAGSYPEDVPGKPGSAMPQWAELFKTSENAPLEPAFRRYLEAINDQIDDLRAGKRPQVLLYLEECASHGSDEARYYLAKVLWGRETQRSEQMMIQLARSGMQRAQHWCDLQQIDWK